MYWTQKTSWAYGRLLFPAIAPIALFLVLGWLYVFPLGWRRLTLALAAGVYCMVPGTRILPLGTLFGTLRRFSGVLER